MPSDILGCLGDGSDHRHWEGFRNRCLAQHTHARALINAKSVGFTAAGASGVYLKTLFEKLNISDELKPKLKLLPGAAGEAVAKGEVEIGLTQISEILPYTDAELVGPLPSHIQSYTYFSAAASGGSKEAAAAKAFIKFLANPAALAVIKAKGMEPG